METYKPTSVEKLFFFLIRKTYSMKKKKTKYGSSSSRPSLFIIR